MYKDKKYVKITVKLLNGPIKGVFKANSGKKLN
jgi:hypothetical protein